MAEAKPNSDNRYVVEGQEIIGPGVKRLVEWSLDNGVVNQALFQHEPGAKDLGIGTFYNDKVLAVLANSPAEGSSAVVHELVHAFVRSGLPSRTKKMREGLAKLPFVDRAFDSTVYPKHWKEGKVDNPLIKKSFSGSYIYPIDDRLLGKTTERRIRTVTDSIPLGSRWSGLAGTKSGKMNRGPVSEEGHAYYFTELQLNENYHERLKELGMFLYDFGVPDDIVGGVITDLKQARPVGTRYSGGGENLWQLRERYSVAPSGTTARRLSEAQPPQPKPKKRPQVRPKLVEDKIRSIIKQHGRAN